MWKFIVTAIIWTYHSLPQCDMGHGAICLVAHGEIKPDTTRIEFYNRAEMVKWISTQPKEFNFMGIRKWANEFKIDSVKSGLNL